MRHCKQERKAKTKLTLRNLSRKLEKTENYLSSVESGRQFPSLKTFFQYLLILGFDPSPLFKMSIQDREDQIISSAGKEKQKLINRIYSLDEDQVSFLIEQSKVAEAFGFKAKKRK